MKLIYFLASILFVAGCRTEVQQELRKGYYSDGHPDKDFIYEKLARSNPLVILSSSGLTLYIKDENVPVRITSLTHFERMLNKVNDWNQIRFIYDKNVAKENNNVERIIKFLKDLGYKVIIVEQEHPNGIFIEEVYVRRK